MTSELVVDVQPKEISIALLEDKALVEFQKEGRSASFNVGNMYLGRVKKLMPGLNACFVDVGFEKDAFLHYLDLGPQFHSYQKYLKQVLSDRKKLFPITKATMLPDIEKEGQNDSQTYIRFRLPASHALAGKNPVPVPARLLLLLLFPQVRQRYLHKYFLFFLLNR